MFSVFYRYEIIKIYSPGSSLNLYMKININNEYIYSSSPSLSFSLISLLNNCSVVGGNTESTDSISPLRYQQLFSKFRNSTMRLTAFHHIYATAFALLESR